MGRMFTAYDAYEAFLAGQEWWREQLRSMGIATIKPYEWRSLPELEKRKWEIMADHLNQQIEAEREEQADGKIASI